MREAFEQARAAAIRAAGELDDPEAVAVFGDLLASSDSSRESWYAAAWSLARSSAPAAAEHMRRFAVPEQEGLIATLACAALARTGTPGSAGDLPRVSRMAAQTSHPLQRRVCAFAEAALTPDDQLPRMYDRLQAADPTLAAIAAWRIGQVDREHRPRAAVAALLRRYVGVPGLARDASAAALARQLGDGPDEPPPAGQTAQHAGRRPAPGAQERLGDHRGTLAHRRDRAGLHAAHAGGSDAVPGRARAGHDRRAGRSARRGRRPQRRSRRPRSARPAPRAPDAGLPRPAPARAAPPRPAVPPPAPGKAAAKPRPAR